MAGQDKPLAVTMGDPAGCGPQITVTAWKQRNALNLAPFFVLADPGLFSSDVPVVEISAPSEASNVFQTALPVFPIDLAGVDDLEVGTPRSDYAAAITSSIAKATHLCLSGEASAVVTNPINKAVLYEAGFSFPGHTEFIADLCSDEVTQIKPVMMLVGGGLRVALASIHVPLMRVLDHLTPQALSETARITHKALQDSFGLRAPRIAFSGLNPHAGEDGTIGTEERDIINPVAEALRSEGLNVSNARPGDTVFHEALSGKYDAVIAMTHDQGLIPVKTLDMWGGVNTTLGLPIIRTSPDHGTAYEAAANGDCRADSLIAALTLATEMAQTRNAAHG
ncbi:MAG: 4-hydroxythreonine-4-phosphate dehydrogenase PdxA [Pseudomonadota bacterium]